MPINSNNLIIKKDNIVEKSVVPSTEKKVLKIQGNKIVDLQQPVKEPVKKKIIEKPVESYYLKKRELAKQNEFIRVNGSKKDWTKSDYFVDMLSKEY